MHRRFILQRAIDSTGISGTGKVAEGVMFSSGRVSLTWLSPYTSVGAYDNMEVVEALHGHGGNTRVVWIDASDECTREHCGITGPHLKSQHEGRTA